MIMFVTMLAFGWIVAEASRAARGNGLLGFSPWKGLQVPLIVPIVALTVTLLISSSVSGLQMATYAVLAIGGPVLGYCIGRRKRRLTKR